MANTDRCVSCRRQVHRSASSSPQITCRECRRDNRAAQPRQPKQAPRAISCQACGDSFESKSLHARFCSQRCRSRHNESSRHKPRTCPACGKTYTPTVGRQKTCSRECAARTPRSLRAGDSYCLVFYSTCRRCSKAYVVTPAASLTHCSEQCATIPVRRCRCGKPVDGARKKCDGCLTGRTRTAAKRRRRRASRGQPLAEGEWYTLEYVATRDRFRCGICREHVEMDHRVPHPLAPTIDHVIPIARGGEDTKANVQLAHFLCNSRKGDRGGGEQLALIG